MYLTFYPFYIFIIVYEEKYQYKQNKRDERRQLINQLNTDPSQEFDIVVKAANPKKKISTMVII